MDLHSQHDQLERVAALIPAVQASADHPSTRGGSLGRDRLASSIEAELAG
jgi:hypothetical protein